MRKRRFHIIARLPLILAGMRLLASVIVFGIPLTAPRAQMLPVLLYGSDFPVSLLTNLLAAVVADRLPGL